MTIDAERQARDLLLSHFRRDIAVNRLKLGYRKVRPDRVFAEVHGVQSVTLQFWKAKLWPVAAWIGPGQELHETVRQGPTNEERF